MVSRPVDLLYKLLARLVLRVRLAREDNLHRALRIVDDSAEPVGVSKEKGGPLVSCKAPCEAKGQRIRIKWASAMRCRGHWHSCTLMPFDKPAPREFDHGNFQANMYIPKLLVRSIV